jgi:ribonuclease E
MTTEDVAADARVEAGLADAEPGAVTAPDGSSPSKPKIGDTRPAPAGTGDGGTTQKRRRRRRGGRGRGRTGPGDTAATSVPEAVRADVGVDGAAVSLDELDDTALERRRGRTRKGRPAGRYMMCVHVREDRTTHIGVMEGRSLVEHYVGSLEPDDTAIDGNIYLGKVQNVLPGMEAAFIDIGTPKNGVLYRGDVAFDPSDVEESHPRIERLLKNGQAVLVQVTKNPIGAKGARLTQEVSLAGRFVVMVPGQPETYGISKRLPDDERKRLRRVLEGLRPPDAGLIVRTAAEGATDVELRRDVERLRAQWEQISKVASRAKAPSLVYQEPTLVVRVIREEFTKEYRGVIIDDRDLYEQVRSYVEAIAPELADRVEYYDPEEEGLPLYERFHVQEQLLKALDRKVWLPSGGSLIVESTEALTVIDVNTGKNVGRSNLEETVYRNNLEAAEEVARQLRLRDIGGIIVIDFIDMEIRKNRDEVIRAFRDALARDKTRTQVFDISELGLVEMTRKRISEGLVETFSETCPTCQGRGFLVDESLLQ